MKSLVLYDSLYGNTEKIARAIAEGLGGETEVKNLKSVNQADLHKYDLLVIGSPVHGGMPTPAMDKFLKLIPKNYLHDILFTTFDTRFAVEGQGFGIRLLMNLIQYAAEKMAKTLTDRGGTLRAKPQGFIVREKDGPLKEGEIERAIEWGKILS